MVPARGEVGSTLGKGETVKRAIAGVVVGIGILVVLLLRVDLRQLGAVLWGVHIGLLAVGLVIKVAVMWLKAARWAITIRAVTGRPVRHAFSASMIGFAGNVLLPARFGQYLYNACSCKSARGEYISLCPQGGMLDAGSVDQLHAE